MCQKRPQKGNVGNQQLLLGAGYLVFIVCMTLLPLRGVSQDYEYDQNQNQAEETTKEEDYDVEEYSPPPNNVVKTSFSSLLISQNPLTGELRIGYEFAPWSNLATFVSASILYPNILGQAAIQSAEDSVNSFLQNNYNNPQELEIRMIGYRVQVGQKFYVLKDPKMEAPEGLYVGPMVSFAETKLFFKGYPDDFVKMTYFSANFMVGYQFVFGDKVALDLTTGLRYRYNYYNLSNTDKKIDETIQGPFGNKQKGLFYMNQIQFGLGFNF